MAVPLGLMHREGKPFAVRAIGRHKLGVELVRFGRGLGALQEMVVACDGDQCMMFETSVTLDRHSRRQTFGMPRHAEAEPFSVRSIDDFEEALRQLTVHLKRVRGMMVSMRCCRYRNEK